jgi:hypothetical protein
MSDQIADLATHFPALVPDLSTAERIVIASDYGGQHDLPSHRSYAMLLADSMSIDSWDAGRVSVRERHLTDGRRMSYKKLTESLRWKALPEFLQAADELKGVLMTVLVDRRIESVLSPDVTKFIRDQLPHQENLPKRHILEYMIRIALFMSLLAGGLLRDGQDVVWITDEDPTVDSSERKAQMSAVLRIVSSQYEPPDFKSMKSTTTASPDPSKSLEDLAAIPDLAAGALTAVLTEYPDLLRSIIAGGRVVPSERMQEKTKHLMGWLSWKRAALKRWVFVIDPDEQPGGLQFGLKRLHDADDPMPPDGTGV